MGNLFDNIDGTSQLRREQSKVRTGLTPEKTSHLTRLFEGMAFLPNESFEERVERLSVLSHSKTFALAICMDGALLSSYKNFEDFSIRCTRVNSAVTIQTLWDIMPRDMKSKSFLFYLLEEFGANDVVEVTVPYLVSYIKKCLRLVGDSYELSLEDIQNWIDGFAPRISAAIETRLNAFFFGSQDVSFQAFAAPVLLGGSEIVPDLKMLPLAWYNASLQGEWTKLYTTSKDGFSFNRIMHHIIGFEGTTCFLIKCMDGRIFGAVAFDTWKESNQFFGSSRNILFSVHPHLNIIRSKPSSNGAYQWLNSNSYGSPHGIGFGGTRERFRLFIPDTLENCIIHGSCLTYESCIFDVPTIESTTISAVTKSNQPTILTATTTTTETNENSRFAIDVIEVWGCGGLASLARGQQAQSTLRAIKDEAIQRARKVDKAAFFDNEFNNEFLLSKTMQHRNEISDR